MRAGSASRTAVLVCQGRAAADGRIAPDVFHDPVAMELLRPDERVPVQWVRDGAQPKAWADRMAYESVRACASLMVPRTVAIDQALAAHVCPQLVVLGAGLDDRAWRMTELVDVDVYEVDHPDSQRDKQDRVGERVPASRSVRHVAVDFARDPLGARLSSAGHDAAVPTVWLWEGVVPYLTTAQVVETVLTVERRSAPGSRLVVAYQSPSLRASVGMVAARVMTAMARQRSVWADEPRRSSWTADSMRDLLAGHGFVVTSDEDLRTVAERIGAPLTHARSAASGRVAVADRT